MSASTNILTTLQPDDALAQNSASFTASDRQFIDTQIRGCQQHLATLILNGVHATYVRVDAGSATLAKGDVVCLGASALGYPTVTLANSAALAVAGSAFGVVLLAAAPGAYALIAIGGVVGPTVTGLAATAGVVRVSTAGRPERVAAFTAGDYALGTVDSTGYMTIAKATVAAAASGLGVSGSVDNVPAMVSQLVGRDGSGDADFHAIDVGVNIDVGVAADGGTYTRIQNTVPTALRQVSTASDGRLRVYAEGSARSCPTFYDTPQEGDLPKLADSIPGDIMGERILFTGSPYDIPSAFVSFWPDAPLTANDTNYAEFTIRVRDGAGSPADSTDAATTQTAGGGGTDDWDAFVAVPLVSGLSVPAGSIVTVEMEKILAGVSVPSGKFKFFGRRAS